MPRGRVAVAPEIRFWKMVQKTEGCWEWVGWKDKNGYGEFRTLANKGNPRKKLFAHRYAWMLAYGEIPPGLGVCHHCDNPACLKTEPDEKYPHGHLFLGTQLDNMRDCKAKGRHAHGDAAWRKRGEEHGGSKLKEPQVYQIRRRARDGVHHLTLAKDYGVSRALIHAVVTRRAWMHLSDMKEDTHG